ncbi:hypothetical protein EXU48_19975 [Occultella glacieicola]|uniref:Universal stress protein n=1 Tax=Occultella glacieicola TaxID=2518684 RepID=A0ABY2DYY6_9MICO|nr:hypothetical protein [Occultella glacieicola]TDE89698.1 hypothetical protein EXU48_19975 [Occultella glacieicola]
MSVRIAVSGHRIYDDAARDVIAAGVRAVLVPYARRSDGGPAGPTGPNEQRQPAHLVSSLAEGADQLAAEIALSLGLRLEVVLPAAGYAESLLGQFRDPFEDLLARADSVRVLDYDEPGPDAYLAAGLAVLEGADLLLAVWDGQAERGVGGTAQVVAAARDAGIEVVVVWPDDYERPE